MPGAIMQAEVVNRRFIAQTLYNAFNPKFITII